MPLSGNTKATQEIPVALNGSSSPPLLGLPPSLNSLLSFSAASTSASFPVTNLEAAPLDLILRGTGQLTVSPPQLRLNGHGGARVAVSIRDPANMALGALQGELYVVAHGSGDVLLRVPVFASIHKSHSHHSDINTSTCPMCREGAEVRQTRRGDGVVW